MTGIKVTRLGKDKLAKPKITSFYNQLTQMLINVKLIEEKRAREGGCSGHVEEKQGERRRVSKRGTEIERGWANKGNKERMRLMAERSWHSAIHSVVAPRRTSVRSLG